MMFLKCIAAGVAFFPLAALCGTLERYVERFNAEDEELYTNAIPNAAAAEFMKANVPTFECPDGEIERAYYFRWWTYRKHLKKTPEGWVVTEFLPKVNWSGPHNAIICALGHHIMEGRWLRDNRFLDDYCRFWFKGSGKGKTTVYTSWPAHALRERARVTGDTAVLDELFDSLLAQLDRWDKWFGKTPPGAKPEYRLAWTQDWREGSELSCGGHGFRPLVNAMVWGDATALGDVARRLGRADAAAHCDELAELYRKSMFKLMWHGERKFFTVISTNGEHKTVRELHGFMPWYMKMPLKGFEEAWRPLMDDRQGFSAKYGLTVPERCAPDFALDYAGHDCKWNGPSWPYATAFTLTALANALQAEYALPVTRSDYVALLHQYAAQHSRKLEDGRLVSWIDENLNPDTGEWIARAINMRAKRKPRERGKDYNHSTFCDLVISGLVGIVPQDGDRIEVDPLFPASWGYLALRNVRYHGHDISVTWDPSGKRYGEKGFCLSVDGRVVARSPKPSRLAARGDLLMR